MELSHKDPGGGATETLGTGPAGVREVFCRVRCLEGRRRPGIIESGLVGCVQRSHRRGLSVEEGGRENMSDVSLGGGLSSSGYLEIQIRSGGLAGWLGLKNIVERKGFGRDKMIATGEERRWSFLTRRSGCVEEEVFDLVPFKVVRVRGALAYRECYCAPSQSSGVI